MEKILIAIIGDKNANHDSIFWHGGDAYSVEIVRKDTRFELFHTHIEYGEIAKQRLYDAEMSRCNYAPISEWKTGYRSLYKKGVLHIPNYA